MRHITSYLNVRLTEEEEKAIESIVSKAFDSAKAAYTDDLKAAKEASTLLKELGLSYLIHDVLYLECTCKNDDARVCKACLNEARRI